MAINITMPALSPTMEEGNLAKWMVREGDEVSAGDIIAEIETDKATMEVEAVDEGKIAKLLVVEGSEGVKVNTVIAILAEEGENPADISVDMPNEKVSAPVVGDEKPVELQPTNPGPAGSISDPQAEVSDVNTRVFSSPLARRTAKNAGIELTSIEGSGPHGRIIVRDVEAAIAGGVKSAPRTTTVPGAPQSLGPSDAQTLKIFTEGSYDLIPHDNIRKIIATRLVQSKQSVPHFYLNVDCEIDHLLDIRKQLNSAAPMIDEKPVFKVSVNDMIIKALALALRDVPNANVSWTQENMVHHKSSDVGVAVSIPGGLITPIVRNAETKMLSQIASEMKDLATRARNRKLKPEEYQGGSTAVSNLGMFGIREFSAVINPPQATILAVGSGEKRVIVRDGEMVVATMMSVTLSTDHRAVDGVLGAQLLGIFKNYIENPVGMLV